MFKRCFSTMFDRNIVDKFTKDKIRNFCIIAHIDHGKSTLADRILEMTGSIKKLEKHDVHQVLDTLKVERERGITVLSQAASMIAKYNNENYLLNLIDTPGHVDFSYQVSRSLRACQGAVLIVDATSGIQAQTLSNYQKAVDANLKVIPVINKIDLETANVERAIEDLVLQLDFDENDIVQISAKTGYNIDKLIEKIIKNVSPPTGNTEKETKCFLFNADYLEDRGVKCMVEIIDGELDLTKHRSIYSYHKQEKYDMFEIGMVTPSLVPTGYLKTGQVGYILSSMKYIKDAHIGDTFYIEGTRDQIKPFPGYEPPLCMVFAGFYPENATKYENCEKAINSVLLTDGSVSFKYESSSALGGGFRLGFLGMLHMDVFRQRLLDEHNMNVIITNPSVTYRCKLRSGETIDIDSPVDAPEPEKIKSWEEVYCDTTIMTPRIYYEQVNSLCLIKRGQQVSQEFIEDQVKIKYDIPLAEMIDDFFDILKSVTSGFASLEYKIGDFRPTELSQVVFHLNNEPVDALTFLIYKENARKFALNYCEKLKDILPRQQFKVAIQAKIGGKVIARSDLKAFRKDVTAKLYGGDNTRRTKLLDKQKKGKKIMRQLGKIHVSSDVFFKLLKR